MTTRELYDKISAQVEDLQKRALASGRDQVYALRNLEEKQIKLKATMEIIMKDGDRPLSGTEILSLGEPDGDKAALEDVMHAIAPFAKPIATTR